ncbi:MAG: VOC family protein, partial [Bacteroidia bacterium]|nr:VOC family protein [Bacteroidia bacterium]
TKLTDGGQESQCGWLKDKFGLSWQIVPSVLGKLMSDPVKRPKVMEAFLKMKKFDIEKLMQA